MSDPVAAPAAGGPHGGRRLCGSRTKQEESAPTCGQWAGWGTSHPGYGECKLHGGGTPNGRLAAERQKAEEALEDARTTYGLPVDVDPGEALLQLVHTSAGAVAWLGRRVAELDHDRVTTVDGKTHPLVQLYLDERKELARVSKDTLAAGVAERQAQLAEDHARLLGQLMVTVLEGFALATGLDMDRPEIRAAAHESLRVIEGGTT